MGIHKKFSTGNPPGVSEKKSLNREEGIIKGIPDYTLIGIIQRTSGGVPGEIRRRNAKESIEGVPGEIPRKNSWKHMDSFWRTTFLGYSKDGRVRPVFMKFCVNVYFQLSFNGKSLKFFCPLYFGIDKNMAQTTNF